MERIYLTPQEMVARYKNAITEKTLANWRSSGEGPTYTKIGGKILYPLDEVRNWECSRTIGVKVRIAGAVSAWAGTLVTVAACAI